MQGILRTLRRTVRPNYAQPNDQFRCVDAFYGNCAWIIRFFYISSLIFSYNFISKVSHKNFENADFLWPVAWLEIDAFKGLFVAVPIIMFLANCAVVIKYELRILRILFSLFCLFVAAMDNSFGALNHGWHIWFWISFLLILLPARGAMGERGYKLATVSIIVYVQAMILLSYSMAGSLKLVAGIKSLVAGEMGNFSLLGFSSLLADRMVQGRGSTILGEFFVDNPYFGFPIFVALIFLQAFSFPVAFFPRLHRVCGLTLIGFHLGTGLLMDIFFTTHILWAALFLVCSPFRIDRGTWRGIDRNWFE